MKKVLSILGLLAAFTTNAQTPITLSRIDFPCPSAATCGLPDSVLFTNVPLSGNSVNTATSGANSTWNMAALTNGTVAYQNFFPMSGTPLIFQLVFLSCDYAQPLLGNNAIGNLPITDAYEYYNYAGTNSSRLEIKGFGAYVTIPGQTTALPLPAIYNSADVIYQFPITFGNTDSSLSGYSVSIPLGATIGNITIKRNQKRVNEVDGWGSITTPAGTFDVLRVKASIDRIDSIITGIFPIGFPSKPIEYKWLGKGKKIPVLQVNGTMNGSTFAPSAITYWGQMPFPAALPEISSTADMTIFPNPSSDNATIRYTLTASSDIDMYISDAEGKLVGQFHFKNQSAGTHNEILPVAALAQGAYTIKCISAKEVIASKFVKF